MAFYVGSCRYLKGPEWKHSFPARLHTTKEMIYFFENIKNIKQIIKEYPEELVNRIFGDITHSAVKSKTNEFLKTKLDKKTSKVFLEVCSRKICYYTNPTSFEQIPIKWTNNPLRKNNFTFKEVVKKYNISFKELTDDEIENDLIYLSKLVKKIFNNDTKLYIIPNINLRIKNTKRYIPKRDCLVNALNKICLKHHFLFLNVGVHLESLNNDVYLEDVMPEGGSHYAKNSKKQVIKYLNEFIHNN